MRPCGERIPPPGHSRSRQGFDSGRIEVHCGEALRHHQRPVSRRAAAALAAAVEAAAEAVGPAWVWGSVSAWAWVSELASASASAWGSALARLLHRRKD